MGTGAIMRVLASLALCAGAPALAAPFNPAPWVADLEQARQAFREKYANWDWVEAEREVRIEPLFDDLAARMSRAPNETAARAIFDRLTRKLGDGHVEIQWPDPPRPQGSTPGAPTVRKLDTCADLGFDERQNSAGTAASIPGYRALRGDNPVAAGTLRTGDTIVGVVRIGVFHPNGFPQTCRAALRQLALTSGKPCDEACEGAVGKAAYTHLTRAIEQRIEQLKAAGATVILVDISGNGGGSEWTEAAARMFTSRQLVSARRGFVRHEHWAKQWRELAADLRAAAANAPQDRQRLLAWAAQADAAEQQAMSRCTGATACTRLGVAGFSTGLVGSAGSGSFDGKPWGERVFSPAKFTYRDGVWSGPLIVLVDQETWSAAEQFAAVLQDNRAAVIMGARTGGAGCGYTNGGMPTKLSNSGATLKLPDCARLRADGSNEVRGIIPDVLVGLRADDGAGLRARLVAEQLPMAVARAQALARSAERR